MSTVLNASNPGSVASVAPDSPVEWLRSSALPFYYSDIGKPSLSLNQGLFPHCDMDWVPVALFPEEGLGPQEWPPAMSARLKALYRELKARGRASPIDSTSLGVLGAGCAWNDGTVLCANGGEALKIATVVRHGYRHWIGPEWYQLDVVAIDSNSGKVVATWGDGAWVESPLKKKGGHAVIIYWSDPSSLAYPFKS